MRKLPFPLAALMLTAIAAGQGGSRGARNPFNAPEATVHYAPDRTYDLQNLVLDFDVDYPNRAFTATATNSVVALRDGITKHLFNASARLAIDSVEVDRKKANFTRDAEGIWVETAPTKKGQALTVTVHYHSVKSEGGGGGWHWHEPKKNDSSKIGFFTNGETSDTRDWTVTWDYPNDFTTTETRATVPEDWSVVGNGLMVSDTPAKNHRHTVVWRLDEPHATYLTSMVAGPFDIHKDSWRGVPLMYVCPKGMGDKLDYTFAHTKDILSFYSDKLGVKYPWPKYAQDITYDFGGGQENVSATTYGLFLTDPRSGYYAMDSLIAHETGHQWFGDYVTCKDWGQIWLNESFATFMEMSYMLQSEGINESLREVESNSQGYFAESRRYQRPLATNLYSNPGVMFDQHTYPKGGVLLMSLRHQIGEEAFYAGLHRYLTTRHNGRAETNDLCEAMTEASGINLHPWFDQWILKPGHPVIDWSWSYDDAAKAVVVKVKQTQDTSKGIPIYDVPTSVGLLNGDSIVRAPIHLTTAEQTFTIPAETKPESVAFDPDHVFLREIPKQVWTPAELPAVLRADPNPIDRTYAFLHLLDDSPSDATIKLVTAFLQSDQDRFPAIVNTSKLAGLNREDLRSFWNGELAHANYARRETAVGALAGLAPTPERSALFRSLINDKQPYRVVAAAIRSLGATDFAASKELIEGQAKTSPNMEVRRAALVALVTAGDPVAADAAYASVADNQPDGIRTAGLQALESIKGDDPRLIPALRSCIQSETMFLVLGAARIAADRKLTALIPDLQAVGKSSPRLARTLETYISTIKGG